MSRIARGGLQKLRFRARLERSHLAAIEIRNPWSVGIVRSDEWVNAGPAHTPGEVRFAVGHARNDGLHSVREPASDRSRWNARSVS